MSTYHPLNPGTLWFAREMLIKQKLRAQNPDYDSNRPCHPCLSIGGYGTGNPNGTLAIGFSVKPGHSIGRAACFHVQDLGDPREYSPGHKTCFGQYLGCNFFVTLFWTNPRFPRNDYTIWPNHFKYKLTDGEAKRLFDWLQTRIQGQRDKIESLRQQAQPKS